MGYTACVLLFLLLRLPLAALVRTLVKGISYYTITKEPSKVKIVVVYMLHLVVPALFRQKVTKRDYLQENLTFKWSSATSLGSVVSQAAILNGSTNRGSHLNVKIVSSLTFCDNEQ
jgi:hypothetical protein